MRKLSIVLLVSVIAVMLSGCASVCPMSRCCKGKKCPMMEKKCSQGKVCPKCGKSMDECKCPKAATMKEGAEASEK